jgi:predicted Na+-dependent transporter
MVPAALQVGLLMPLGLVPPAAVALRVIEEPMQMVVSSGTTVTCALPGKTFSMKASSIHKGNFMAIFIVFLNGL